MALRKLLARLVFLVFVVAAMAIVLLTPKPKFYAFEFDVGGVPFYSDFPPEALVVEGVRVKGPEGLRETCELELAAIVGLGSYEVLLEEGERSVYLEASKAKLRGKDARELLEACHAFACLLAGLRCENFKLLKTVLLWMLDSGEVHLVVEGKGASQRAALELIAALGFVQGHYAKQGKELRISLYLKEGDVCSLQPLRSLYQNLSEANVSCSALPHAILLEVSPKNALLIRDRKFVVIAAEGKKLEDAAIVLRDILAPGLARAIYRT